MGWVSRMVCIADQPCKTVHLDLLGCEVDSKAHFPLRVPVMVVT